MLNLRYIISDGKYYLFIYKSIQQYMPNNDLFTNDVMTFRLNDSYYMRTTVLCSCHVWYV